MYRTKSIELELCCLCSTQIRGLVSIIVLEDINASDAIYSLEIHFS